MKVMIVGGNQMKYVASRYYDFANKICNGLIRGNHTVIRFYDRDVARLANPFRSRKLGVKAANNKLLEYSDSFKPDLFLFFHADVIRLETLEKLKEQHPDAKFAQISIDPLFIPGNVTRLAAKSPILDATFITTAGEGLKKISGGKPAYYIPNVIDPSIETGRAFATDCDIDLIFACGSYDRLGGDPRKALVNLILERLPDVNFNLYVDYETGGLWGAKHMDELARSKCGLNLSRDREGHLNIGKPEDLYIYSSDRISYLTGNGVLTFSDKKYDLDKLYTADEMVFYESNEDLIEKIAYFLENEAKRCEIAKNGWEKGHSCLNERLGAQYIIDVLFHEELSHPYIWPTEAVISS